MKHTISAKLMPKSLHRWINLQQDDGLHTMPTFDIAPHGKKISDTEYELSAECACKPKIVTGNEDGMYETPMIVHNSFQDAKRIKESMGL